MASIVEQAIQLEMGAEESYRKASQATSDPSARKILGLLADEEARHARVLQSMEDPTLLDHQELLTQVSTWICESVEGGAQAISSDAELPAVLRQAMVLEQKTERFYREKAFEAEDEKVRELFITLAAMENTHFALIGSWIEYFDRPKEWIENAEFGLREEY